MHSMREPVSDGNVPPQSLLERLKDYGQEDVFALWDELSTEERDLLIKDIESIDLPRIDRIIRCSFRSQGLPAAAIEPIPESNVSTVEKRTMEERERWWKMGLKAISDGKLGVLLLSGGQVTFFQQGTIPCVSRDGRFIMEAPYRVARSPDGNGGVYSALKSSKLLEDMAMRGIKYLDCYGVDNALVRVGDPTFLGYFIDKGAAAAAKVVRKAYPQEKVGVFVRRGKGGPTSVVEYSELDASLASAINQETGRLRFCWSNVLREEEFAPVKNANGSNFDTPESACLLVLRLHARWVVAAGGFLTHSVPLYQTGVEVSPLCSYAGENLEAICRGRTFHAPCEISF
ncbi:hypothetical protein ACS0TY_019006 [Phlomoides rotata]